MDHMLYVSMTGAVETMNAQAINAHNLANASTTGFKADLHSFQAITDPSNLQSTRVYSMREKDGVNFSEGTLQRTGRDLDIAINGKGWIAVQSMDGNEAYTRSGNLSIDPSGQLLSGRGHPVLGDGGPIVIPPTSKVTIGQDGTITVQPVGQGPEAPAVIDRIRLVNPPENTLQRAEGGLFVSTQANIESDGTVFLVPKALEGSNVNSIDAMVEMISLSRQYEAQIKMMKMAKDNASSSASLLRTK